MAQVRGTVGRHAITFVTGNAGKLRQTLSFLGPGFPYPVVGAPLDLPELQGEPAWVSAEKCRLAAEKLQRPVLVDDTSLCFNALGGLPGVYIKWFLEKMGHANVHRLLHGFEDKSAYGQCVLAFSKGPGDTPTVFVGRTEGVIVAPRFPPSAASAGPSPRSFGWDPIFQPSGYDKTYAELSEDVKLAISDRAKAIQQLGSHFRAHGAAIDADLSRRYGPPPPLG